MAWFCQRECYATTLETTIESFEAASESSLKLSGFANDASGTIYEIVFADTVLFPEGGGQPDDRGVVEVLETGEQFHVLRVLRSGQRAIHYARMTGTLETGVRVRQRVDWSRRFDHMQQHTGQHLITAVVERIYGWKTTSWNLGDLISTIELEKLAGADVRLDTSKGVEKAAGKSEQKNTCELDAAEVEKTVNERVLLNLSVSVKLINSMDDAELKTARTRGLPADVPLPIRIVSIGEGDSRLDANLCCGTHVHHLGDLQSISILNIVSSKKGRATLSFLSGQRVLRYLRAAYTNERQLTALLNVPAEQHADAIKRSQQELRVATKMNLMLLREVAVFEARTFYQAQRDRPTDDATNAEEKPSPSRLRYLLFSTHRKEGDIDFMNFLANELDRLFTTDSSTKAVPSNNTVMEPSQQAAGHLGKVLAWSVITFLSVGDDRKEGSFLFTAAPNVLSELSPRVNELLEAKAFANKAGTRLQGRTSKMVARKNVLQLLSDYVAQHSA